MFITEVKSIKKRSVNEKNSLISNCGFPNQPGRSVGGGDEVNNKHMESIHENKENLHNKQIAVKNPKPRNMQMSKNNIEKVCNNFNLVYKLLKPIHDA